MRACARSSQPLGGASSSTRSSGTPLRCPGRSSVGRSSAPPTPRRPQRDPSAIRSSSSGSPWASPRSQTRATMRSTPPPALSRGSRRGRTGWRRTSRATPSARRSCGPASPRTPSPPGRGTRPCSSTARSSHCSTCWRTSTAARACRRPPPSSNSRRRPATVVSLRLWSRARSRARSCAARGCAHVRRVATLLESPSRAVRGARSEIFPSPGHRVALLPESPGRVCGGGRRGLCAALPAVPLRSALCARCVHAESIPVPLSASSSSKVME
mmetsp:Transcript_59558/g.158344  ORF Transcript_59558/g.158344 Transcript_59558/m.158344 type:complete len:270 (+) Transcript_59558:183-992(+)